MITNATELPQQSSAADWIESIELRAEDDDARLWASVPADLVATLRLIPEGISLYRDYGHNGGDLAAVLTATTNDGTDRLTAFENGFLEINVPAATMAELAPDRYGVLKRYQVFVKLTTNGQTMQLLCATLPVYLGA